MMFNGASTQSGPATFSLTLTWIPENIRIMNILIQYPYRVLYTGYCTGQG